MSTISDILGINRQPWMDDAKCREVEDPDIFHIDSIKPGAHLEAQAICQTCPVARQCREYSLSIEGDLHGVWGGMTEMERLVLKRRGLKFTTDPRCGTKAGVSRHYRQRESLCPRCTAHNRALSAERRGLKMPTADPKCGTATGANYHQKRGELSCDSCRQAATEARRTRRGQK